MDTDEMAELDERFMREALAEARVAAQMGEVPIGAVVVHEGKVIARAHNLREHDEDPSAHAEFSAMVAASRALGRWRLTGCTVFVTLEPCTMCAGLMVNARIDRCVYGAADPKGGALGSLYDLNEDDRLNHAFEVTAGVLEDECAAELTAFFSNLRQHGVTAARRDACADECSAGAAVSPARPTAARRRAVSRPGRSVKNVLLALDAFKGSASSAQVEQWVAEGIARADKTLFGQEGVFDAHSADVEEVFHAVLVRKAAHRLDLFRRLDVLVRGEVVHDHADFRRAFYAGKARLFKFFDCDGRGDVVAEHHVQLRIDELTRLHAFEPRMVREDLL